MDLEKRHKAVRCLKALSHPIRLGILCALKDGPMSVSQLMVILGVTQSNLSQHLANMRERGLLNTEKQSNQVIYSVKNPQLFQLLEILYTLYCEKQGDDE